MDMNYISAYLLILFVFFGSCKYLDEYRTKNGEKISTPLGLFILFVPAIVVGSVLRAMLHL